MKIWDKITEHFGAWKGLAGVGQTFDGFGPTTNDPDLTMDGTGQGVALVVIGGRIRVVNRGATTEGIRIAFGIGSAAAITALTISGSRATTGLFLPPHADGLATVLLGMPIGATHYAIANAVASDTQLVSIDQGI